MDAILEDVSSTVKSLKVKVPWEIVIEQRTKVLDRYQKKAKVPGFRVGKVPHSILEKHYKKEIEEDLKEAVASKTCTDIITEKKLSPLRPAMIQDMDYEEGSFISYSALIDHEPEFTLPNYKDLKVETPETKVEESEIDEVIAQVLESRASFSDVKERALKENDFAVIDYSATFEGKKLGEALPDLKFLEEKTDFWMEIKEDGFLPGFAKNCVGLKPNEKKSVQVTFPKDSKVEAAQGKMINFEVTLKDIKEKKIPALTEELSQEIAKTTIKELRQRIRLNKEMEKNIQARNSVQQQIASQLVDAAQFDVPQYLLQESLNEVVQEIMHENEQRGVPYEEIQKKQKEIIENSKGITEKRIRLRFIMSRIAEAEKVFLTEHDLMHAIDSISKKRKESPKKTFTQLQRSNQLETLKANVLTEKTLEHISADKVPTPPSVPAHSHECSDKECTHEGHEHPEEKDSNECSDEACTNKDHHHSDENK